MAGLCRLAGGCGISGSELLESELLAWELSLDDMLAATTREGMTSLGTLVPKWLQPQMSMTNATTTTMTTTKDYDHRALRP